MGDRILLALCVLSLVALVGWCLACPDHQPVTRAQWEAQLAAEGIGGAE